MIYISSRTGCNAARRFPGHAPGLMFPAPWRRSRSPDPKRPMSWASAFAKSACTTPTGHLQDEGSMAETEQEALEEILAQLRSSEAQAQSGDTQLTTTQPRQNGKCMAVLTDEIKEFIVKGLACYDTPTYLVDAVRVNFGIEVTRQQIYEYDPRRGTSQRWRDLFAATRASFLREAGEIGITHKLMRLRMLDRLAHRCERNSVALAIRCLKEAAKECGGMYENRRPVVAQVVDPQECNESPSGPATPSHAVIQAIPLPRRPDRSGAADNQPLNANRQ
jgi:hypothetical protein